MMLADVDAEFMHFSTNEKFKERYVHQMNERNPSFFTSYFQGIQDINDAVETLFEILKSVFQVMFRKIK